MEIEGIATGLIAIIPIIIVALIIVFLAFKTVRQTERGLIERFGKYNRYAEPGLHIIIPFIERMVIVNITEQMFDADKQEIITDDNLNATVDAQIYYKVRADEESVKSAVYNVNNYQRQIVNLARTTLRNIIGTLTLKTANSERDKINVDLLKTLAVESDNWGIDMVRAELKEIDPPKDVQQTMNQVVKAENEKIAAKDFATAEETKADGIKRAAIKKAEGAKQSRILEAEGEKQGLILEAEGNRQSRILKAEGKAKGIELENVAAQEFFKDDAQTFKALETVAKSLESNTKIVLPVGESLVNVISDMASVTPIPIKGKEGKEGEEGDKPSRHYVGHMGEDEDEGDSAIRLG